MKNLYNEAVLQKFVNILGPEAVKALEISKHSFAMGIVATMVEESGVPIEKAYDLIFYPGAYVDFTNQVMDLLEEEVAK